MLLKNFTKNYPMKPLYFLNGGSINFPLSPKQILLIFLGISFAITAIDVAMAHWQNHFIPPYEWIPVFYSPLAAIATLYYAFKPNGQALRFYQLTMLIGIVMGFTGSAFHLFGNMTVKEDYIINWLIIKIPVFAPLAFSGMALYGLALVNPSPQWLMRFISLGFLVNAITAGSDHALSHFENPYTLFPIVAGVLAFIVTWLCSNTAEDEHGNKSRLSLQVANVFYAVMSMMIVTGVLGFYLHVTTDLEATVVLPLQRFLYHAPVLAPLLFAQLGTMGILSSLSENEPLIYNSEAKNINT